MKLMLLLRKFIAAQIVRRVTGPDFTVISDDCWGGELYKSLNLEFKSPTIGLWVSPEHFIHYVRNFHTIKDDPLVFKDSNKNYPVASIFGVDIYFMHYKSSIEAENKYFRRMSRINIDRFFIKIDFGKPGYKQEDIQLWNSLGIKNSVAFYSMETKIPKEGVHNGICIKEWTLNGADMFNISRRYFDVYHWIKTGDIRNSLIYRILNFIIYDPSSPKRVISNFKKYLKTR